MSNFNVLKINELILGSLMTSRVVDHSDWAVPVWSSMFHDRKSVGFMDPGTFAIYLGIDSHLMIYVLTPVGIGFVNKKWLTLVDPHPVNLKSPCDTMNSCSVVETCFK